MGILQIFTLLGALGMFLYGMNLMSSGSSETPQVLEFVKTWSGYGFWSVLIFLAFGN